MVDNTSEIGSLSNVRCMLRKILTVGRALVLRVQLPTSDTFPATNQFCCHFAVHFAVPFAVILLSFSRPDNTFTFGAKVCKSLQKSTKWHLFGQQL